MDHTDEYAAPRKTGKLHNVLPLWGNENTMNLNPLILANIQSSSYFKVHLFKLKTYHEVVDEIYYQVKHLEPWERGSRKTAGQTGMCGGVRGVGAGGIVSTAYCLLYKMYTLRLTRKQVNGLLTHCDSPYIRSLGFMYIRYTQPPGDLYDWYEEYLQDEEEVDAKAGGGQIMTIGQMLHQWLIKLDWFSTLFPRIPVPIQKQIESKLAAYSRIHNVNLQAKYATMERSIDIGGGSGSGSINSNKRSTDTREYYDRDRDGGSSGGGSGRQTRVRDIAPPTTSYRSNEHDRRYRQRSRSRSKERNNSSSYSGSDRGYKDRYRDNRDRSDYYYKEKSDRKDKDYYRDGESSRHYDDNRHKSGEQRDRRHRY